MNATQTSCSCRPSRMHERPYGFSDSAHASPHDSKKNHSRLVMSRSYENREMLASSHSLRAPVRRRGIIARSLLVSICGYLAQKEGLLFEISSVITPTLSTINLPYPLFATAQPAREATEELLVEDDFENDTLQDGRPGGRGQKSLLLSPINLDSPKNSSDPLLPLMQATENAPYKWIYSRYPGQITYAPRGAEGPQMAYQGEAYPKENEDSHERSSFTDLTHTQNSLTASLRDTSSVAEPDGFVLVKASPIIDGNDVTLKRRERKRRAEDREGERHSRKRRRPRAQQQPKRVRRRRKTLDARLVFVTALVVGLVALLGYQHVQLKRLKKKGDTLDALLSMADALAQRLHDESSTLSSTEVYKLMVDIMTQGQAVLERHADLTTTAKRQRRIEQQKDARKKRVDHLRSERLAQRKGVTEDVKHDIQKISEDYGKDFVELLEEAMKIIDNVASFAET